jgi:Ca2+-binding EF-hand superfamily protein
MGCNQSGQVPVSPGKYNDLGRVPDPTMVDETLTVLDPAIDKLFATLDCIDSDGNLKKRELSRAIGKYDATSENIMTLLGFRPVKTGEGQGAEMEFCKKFHATFIETETASTKTMSRAEFGTFIAAFKKKIDAGTTEMDPAIEELFTSLDCIDADGFVSIAELSKAIGKNDVASGNIMAILGLPNVKDGEGSVVEYGQRFNAAFNEIDTNSDKRMSRAEFGAFIANFSIETV